MGVPGSGKTHTLRTLIDAGLSETFTLFTEPGMEVVVDTRNASEAYKKALAEKRVHWKYIPAAKQGWKIFQDSVTSALNFDIGTLQKQAAMDKRDHAQFMDVLKACESFVCDHCGKVCGNVDDFTTDQAFAFDSLSGLNIMLLGLAAGSKPAITQPEWGQAMKMEEAFLNRLCFGLKTHFILNAHVDRETDMLSGGVKLMPSALGKKLPPVIGRFFSDVIYAEKVGDKFSWNTASALADTKTRNLELKISLEPTFVPIINKWRTSTNV